MPSSNGSCNNIGTASSIGSRQFNNSYASPAHVGYMYGDVYNISQLNISQDTIKYLYGNDVSWDETKFTLVDTRVGADWENARKELAKKFHYTCLNKQEKCSSVLYVNFFDNPEKIFWLRIYNGENIDDAK